MKTLSYEIGSIVELELSQDVDVITCLDNLVKTCQNVMWLSPKGRHPHWIFFNSKLQDVPTNRGFEQLSSSICWRVMTIQTMGVIHPRLAFSGAEIFTKFLFLANNYGSRNGRKWIKGSKDVEFGLVTKKTWDKKWLIGLAPRVW